MSHRHEGGGSPGRKVKSQAVERTAAKEVDRVIDGVVPVDLVNRF